MADLDTDVRYIKGVGEQRQRLLEKLGIHTLRDLIGFFPRNYEDRSAVVDIADAELEQPACIRAMVWESPRLSRIRKGMELVRFRVSDDSGSLIITYFNQSYVKDQFHTGREYLFYGKVSGVPSQKTMSNPVFEPADGPRRAVGRIVPIYPLTAGISQKRIQSAVAQGLDACGDVLPDYLPPAVARRFSLADTAFSYRNIHFPTSFPALAQARRRLIFEELFVLAAALGWIRARRGERQGRALAYHDPAPFYASLPYSPTGAQRRCAEAAFRDMCAGKQMNRLIQGDVGSGKTLVAAACIWLVRQNGCQAAFMAPTELLAEQHYHTLSDLLSPLGVRVERLVGSMTPRQKRQALARLAAGEADLAVGTHALLSEQVSFQNLALVVTDEQHRFGVEQRTALSAKGAHPHVMVMSATPIPRTLALMLYGDLDVSVLDELPPGRQKVDTFAVGEEMRPRLNRFIRKLVSEGRQVYVVCPMIQENEEGMPHVKNVLEHTQSLRDTFPDLRISCVHGKQKPREKDAVMAAFAAGELDILAATTVIEVGVDVPNAALMLIENAERFGLSQLHQLRGRVGRGKHKSYCVLISDHKGEESRARLKILCRTNDGFRISEEDLRLRGPGDFFGSRQHGLPEMRIADLCTDMSLLESAQEAAGAVLQADPELAAPENAALRERVENLFRKTDSFH